MLKGAEFIIELYDNDEFKPIIVQGDHGYGKSSYANTLIAEVYSITNDGVPIWHKKHRKFFSKHLGYSPDEVLEQWNDIPLGKKDYAYHWDDAGNFLHSLDFQDPFVKSVGKYMNVARTDWAAIIFSTIRAEDISSKIRGIRNAIFVDITKDGCTEKQPDIRTATAYILRKGWKGREWKDYQWKERFNSHVPGSVDDPNSFYGWYKPMRDRYAKLAKERARKIWLKKKAKDEEE